MEKTIKELFSDIGIIAKRNSGSEKILCPKCSHTRKKKTDPCLNIDLNTGEYFCHNQGCDFKGGVIKDKNYVPRPKEYVRPVFQNNTKLSDAMVKWFQSRAISQTTLSKVKIGEGVVYMPGDPAGEFNTIQFNYFRNNELVNTKFRTAKKSFKMVRDAELIFYNIDAIKESDWCIITEGEIDALSFIEAGVNEVISVPNGASKGKMNLEYLDNCISYFENKKRIILATDNDEAGITLRDELARRFGHDICLKVDFKTCKDANEYLKGYGAKALKECVTEANLIEFPMSGIITADMVWDNLKDLMINGLTRGDITGLMDDFDKLVSFVPGQLMALTGIPNHGKSPFALQIMVGLSLSHGWKWGICSPEHKPIHIFLVKVCELLLGKRTRPGESFTEREMNLAKAFITEYFFFIEPEDDDYTLDNILEKGKMLVKRKGIRGILIDPWNKLEHNMPKGDNETMYISKELDKTIRFNQKNSVFTIIVAHPTKIRKVHKSSLFEVPNLYDIAGSANWFNKVDIGICFYRNFETKRSEVYVQKIKHEHLGTQGMCELKYNMNNSRFCNLHGDYDNKNWLMPNPVAPTIEFSESKKEQVDLNTHDPSKEPHPSLPF